MSPILKIASCLLATSLWIACDDSPSAGHPSSAPTSHTPPPTWDVAQDSRELDTTAVDVREPGTDGFEPPPEEASLEVRCFEGSQEACDQLGH